MLFQIEKLSDIRDEVQPLLEIHWELIALNQDKIKLNPDWDTAEELCNQGRLKIFTARHKGKLVGYFALVVGTSLHYVDHKFATCDVIFVHPDYRKGMTGYKLIKTAEDYLKIAGVSLININTKVHTPFDRLMEKMGYNLIERLYSKYIGD
jgi:GNAT superfamily N-acetyltransferase